MMATCGEVLVKILENYGIKTLFGIPGVHTVELYRGIENTALTHITPRHEQGAGFMADGYARASGEIPVCLIITGPGMTNIATAMAQALADSIPMLIISSVNRTYELGLGEGRLHELPNQRNVISGVAKFSHTLMRADELPKILARAFSVLTCERPGPVHIEIPIDIITQPADHIETTAFSMPRPPGPDPLSIKNAVAILKSSKTPLIALGGGAIRSSQSIIRLAELLNAPVINTVNAKGVMPYSHPLALGGSASAEPIREELCNADVVLAVGTEFGETDYDYFFKGNLALKGKLIRIDIDASQLTRNVKSDIAICSDASLAINALVDQLTNLETDKKTGIDRSKKIRQQLKEIQDSSFSDFFNCIQKTLPDVVIVGDSTQPTYYAWLHYETEGPRRYFHSASGFGTLGYAIPAAIGAKLSKPNTPVIGLIGDGASQFTIGELSSAVEARISVVFLIWNNQGYREIKNFMIENEIPTIGVDIHTPDFQGIAKAFGCHSSQPKTLEKLSEALIQAQTRELPTVIEVNQSDFCK